MIFHLKVNQTKLTQKKKLLYNDFWFSYKLRFEILTVTFGAHHYNKIFRSN